MKLTLKNDFSLFKDNKTYYVAITAFDEVNLQGPMSNIAEFINVNPVVIIDPTNMTEEDLDDLIGKYSASHRNMTRYY